MNKFIQTQSLRRMIKKITLFLINKLVPSKVVHCHWAYKKLRFELKQVAAKDKNTFTTELTRLQAEVAGLKKDRLDGGVFEFASDYGKDIAINEISRRFTLSVRQKFILEYSLGMSLERFLEVKNNLINHYCKDKHAFLLNPLLRVSILSENLAFDEYYLVDEYIESTGDRSILGYFYSLLIWRDELDTLEHRYTKYGPLVSSDQEFLCLSAWQSRTGKIDTINLRTEKALSVFQFLMGNRANPKALLNQKKIAIVGNASTELGKGKGSEIDSSDIVIRFNAYHNDEKYNHDYGEKIDIWATAFISNPPQKKIVPRYLIPAVNLGLHPITTTSVEKLYDFIVANELQTLSMEDSFSRKQLCKEANVLFPSSGLYTIWCLKKLANPKNVNLYGFELVNQETKWGTRHYQNLEPNEIYKGSWHCWDQERDFLVKKGWYRE